MAYVNITKGARAIHLKAGGHVLVEPGATIDIDEGKIKRVGPGLVLAPNDLPPAPDELTEAAGGIVFDGTGDYAAIGDTEPASPSRTARRPAR